VTHDLQPGETRWTMAGAAWSDIAARLLLDLKPEDGTPGAEAKYRVLDELWRAGGPYGRPLAIVFPAAEAAIVKALLPIGAMRAHREGVAA
jgi:hypothetical protein